MEEFCRQNNATIQSLGQTVWAKLLASYTGEDNVVFGIVFSGGPSRTGNNVAFPSITIIPVPCDTAIPPLEILQDMARFNSSALRHRFIPLVDIQRHAGYENRLLFDTMFVYQKSRNENSTFDWAVVRETAAVDYTASLELEASRHGDMMLHLTFQTDRIPSKQAHLMLLQYDHLLKQIVINGVSRPKLLYSILAPKEPELPSEAQFLHEFVEQGASRHPDRVALTFVKDFADTKPAPESWTYNQLNAQANQIANLLRRAGIQPESIVAVCMEKCPEASFAFIGILKAGCSFLAIDPDLPKARLEFILQDSAAKLLFVNEGKASSFEHVEVECLELSSAFLAPISMSAVEHLTIKPDSTCYCLYTSGTTGTPKGCEITHESTVQAIMSFQRLFAGRWTEKSCWLQFASYWFDVSVLEQFWSWSVGIAVVGAPRDVVLEDLPGFISRYRVTHIDLTPALARLLQPHDVPSLWNGVFITGGEALKQEIIDIWGPKTAICNGYGPTEATIGVTMNTFIGSDAKPSNIGRQFDNVGTYVLRPGSNEPVLRGAVGELCVSGKLVGKGYLNRPELTASQFPTLPGFDERVYRTGDLVRVLADGSFLFVGRQDSQAKLRGQRLEISEIDNVIQHCADDVAHVVSLIIKAGDGGGETLVSFLTKSTQNQAGELEVVHSEAAFRLVRAAKQACLDQLPGYMVPTHILPINCLPLTVNNKVDTKRLKALFVESSPKDLQSLTGSEKNNSAMTTVEHGICSAVCELLSIDSRDVTPLSNLFSLGMSSISAISLSSLLKRRGFKKASVATLMGNATVKQLATAVDNRTNNVEQYNDGVEQAKLSVSAFDRQYRAMVARVLEIAVEDIEALSPCTPLQQGLIIDSTRLAEHPYFNDFVYNLEAADIAKLQEAIQELASCVQILRTKFISADTGTAQVVLKKKLPTVTQRHAVKGTDFTTSSIELKSRWIENNKEELTEPFEAHILHTDDRCLLILHIHHALYDGISYDLLVSHLRKLYGGKRFSNDGPQFIDALPFGPLRQLRSAKSFWQKRLEGITHIKLPVLRSATAKRCHEAAFDLVDAAALESARKAIGVSHQALMQSCFEIALRKCVPSVHLYGLLVSGRSIELAGADQILGPMFNTLPQPLRVATDTSLKEYVRLCHDANVAALPFQHTPLRDIRKWLGQRSADPMFDILFVFHHAQDGTVSDVDHVIKELKQKTRPHYPLACEVELVNSGNMSVRLVAQGEYFEQSDVHSLLDSINDVLHCLLENSDAAIEERFAIETAPVTPAMQNGASPGPQLNGLEHFTWTQSAETIRVEIAALTDLAASEIDEHSTIFALGLDSIDAVKLASRLRKNGLSIPVSKILQAQSIPRMLQTIRNECQDVSSDNAPSRLSQMEQQLQNTTISSNNFGVGNIEKMLPATPAQEALVAEMYRSDLREYFNHDVLRLRPEVDLDRLKKAWQLVVCHTPVLRTLFLEVLDPEIEVVFAQVVLKESPPALEARKVESQDDLEGVFNDIRVAVLKNIENVPPFRLTEIEIRDDLYLILSLAHAQYDGHSLALLHQDVARAYHDCFTPRPEYNDAIEAALVAQNEDVLRFWADTLSRTVARPFPRIGSEREKDQTHRSERHTSLSWSSARSFCKKQGVSMQALAQTCWALTLAHYTRSMEVMFGVVLACRDSKDTDEVVFPTMNTVVMRASLHGSRAQMVQHIQHLSTDMLPYQRTPLRSIQAAVAKMNREDGDNSLTALFDTVFIYQHKPDSQGDIEPPLYESVGGSSDTGYPVAVEMEASDDDVLVIRCACKGFVLDRLGIQELLKTVNEVLIGIFNSPDEPTVDFDEDQVTICGMDSFYLDDLTEESDDTNEQVVEDEDISTDTSPIALSIVQAFAQVAKVPAAEISPSTTIESIGIDSISAIKIAAMLRKKELNLSVSDILRAKTPIRMAEMLRTKAATSDGITQLPSETISRAIQPYMEQSVLQNAGIDPDDVEIVLPATAGQVYLLSMWQKTDGQIFYPTFIYQLNANVEMEEIQQAWKALVTHHAILRTAFCATRDINIPVLQVVLRGVPDTFDKDQTLAVNSNQSMVSLQVENANPGYLLNLSIHHVLYDAISLPLLMHDLQSLLAGHSISAPNLKFEDFIAPSISHRAKQLRKHFWSDNLEDVNPRTLAQPQQDGQQKKIEIFHRAFFESVSDGETRARKENISLQSILFAAYAKIYTSLTSSPEDNEEPADVVLGIYLSNRSHLPDLETLAAPTINLVPLLVRSPQQSSLLEVARRIQEHLQKIGTANHSAVGLWEIEQWTGVKVDTFVNFLKLPEADEDRVEEPDRVVIKPLDGKRLEQRSHVIEPGNRDGFKVPHALEGMKGVDAYQVSSSTQSIIDIRHPRKCSN
jgi:amino acid adenylation domain-containing protein